MLYYCISGGGGGNTGGGGNNGCLDVGLTTNIWANEITWSVGSCTNNQDYANNNVYTQECCLAGGDYTITCTDSYGDGWHGAYLEINGVQYCQDFTSGYEQQAYLTIASSPGKIVNFTIYDRVIIFCHFYNFSPKIIHLTNFSMSNHWSNHGEFQWISLGP